MFACCSGRSGSSRWFLLFLPRLLLATCSRSGPIFLSASPCAFLIRLFPLWTVGTARVATASNRPANALDLLSCATSPRHTITIFVLSTFLAHLRYRYHSSRGGSVLNNTSVNWAIWSVYPLRWWSVFWFGNLVCSASATTAICNLIF